jgi:molybdate transport system substrate-binding protein
VPHSRFAAAAFISIAAGSLFAITCPGDAGAAEVTLLSAGGMRGLLGAVTNEFERVQGHKLIIKYGEADEVKQRIQKGEVADAVITLKPAVETLIKDGNIAPDSRVDLARTSLGVAVRKGSPKPDVSSVEAFRNALLAAKAVAYADPATGSASAIYFVQVLERLGIAQAVAAKARLGSLDILADGQAEIAVQQVANIMRTAGVELVAALPAELQNTPDLIFSGGVVATAKEPEAARSLIRFIGSPTVASTLKVHGLEPM